MCQKNNRHQENSVSRPCVSKNVAPPGGLEPPTFRLTAERASQLRHRGKVEKGFQRLASP